MKIESNKGEVRDISPNFQYDVDKHIQNGNHKVVDEILSYGNKTNVSDIYRQKTGKDWSTAKAEGLTDGSYEANIKLRSDLIGGKYNKPVSTQDSNSKSEPGSQAGDEDYTKETEFTSAFSKARKSLGANKIFEWNGRKYGTNVAGEEFNPDDKEIEKNNLDTKVVRERLNNENKLVKSPYINKEVVKLEPEYKNWETLKARNNEINSMNNADKINKYHESTPDEQYLIVDKKSGRMHIYKGGNKLDSFEVGVGENKGDAQTTTKIKENGKADWNKGNKSTGAGIYTISNVNQFSKEYYNLPSFNMKNENGIEVSTSVHGTPKKRRGNLYDNNPDNNRMSNGCINGKCEDLKKLYSKYKVSTGTKIYILPEDEGNDMVFQDGKIIMKSTTNNRIGATLYTDKNGDFQHGQGINESRNTLKYKPIKMFLDKGGFEKDVFSWNDLNDEKEYENTTKPYIQSLAANKQKVMKVAKISSDIYNEISKMAFGIYGTESNFGDTHSAVGNLARAVTKAVSPKTSSSPDYESKYNTYRADKDTRSAGLTQIRFSYLDNSEKSALKAVGIKSNKDFLDPSKAAMGTAIVLGIRYNQQLTPEEKKDIWKNLPTKWNKRGNYAERVKNNSKYLSIKQLD